jgi:hypothetical protein
MNDRGIKYERNETENLTFHAVSGVQHVRLGVKTNILINNNQTVVKSAEFNVVPQALFSDRGAIGP